MTTNLTSNPLHESLIECLSFAFTVTKYGVPCGSPKLLTRLLDNKKDHVILLVLPVQTEQGVQPVTYVPGFVDPVIANDPKLISECWHATTRWWNEHSPEERHVIWRDSEAYKFNLLSIAKTLTELNVVSRGISRDDDFDVKFEVPTAHVVNPSAAMPNDSEDSEESESLVEDLDLDEEELDEYESAESVLWN